MLGLVTGQRQQTRSKYSHRPGPPWPSSVTPGLLFCPSLIEIRTLPSPANQPVLSFTQPVTEGLECARYWGVSQTLSLTHEYKARTLSFQIQSACGLGFLTLLPMLGQCGIMGRARAPKSGRPGSGFGPVTTGDACPFCLHSLPSLYLATTH